AKTTAWNEFSSTMASAIICLATNQKFNFSKYIFESMVKNLENVSSKFLMYPKFVQVFVNQQLDGLPSHKRIYEAPSHTKKIFGNMKKVGKGFSRRITPLFPTMVVQAQEEIDNVADESVYEEIDDSLERAATTATSLDTKNMSSNTPDYIYPIIVPSDFDVEDAFSSTNTPDYTPASLDYSPASPGNTSPDPSDDLSKYLLASLAISPFHDDPYMKVMHAYIATSNESPIPPPRAPIAPPTILLPSLVFPLSPMFDPQDFFLPEEILPP
ncbi:hypothetical protein Tco_1180180, partial [Tanacetum coccineum]